MNDERMLADLIFYLIFLLSNIHHHETYHPEFDLSSTFI